MDLLCLVTFSEWEKLFLNTAMLQVRTGLFTNLHTFCQVKVYYVICI